MSQIKLAFIGKPSAGQVNAAIYLNSRYKFKRMKLMDGCRRICLTLWGLQKISFHIQWKMYHHLYKFDADIWLKYLRYRLARSKSDVVVEDIRYVSEAESLRKMGFLIVRVSTDRKVRLVRYLKDAAPNTLAMVELSFDPTIKIVADYSIHYTNKQQLSDSLDDLMKSLDKNPPS